ncbi:MAG: glycosyl transferase family 1 [Alphaproteobacteria bacterium]|nr:glycosyl transferase family 1 [Alphaproteobacteria bacterium]
MRPDVKILVLAHDLSDAAIARRVRMLRIGGAQVALAGFCRALQPIAAVESCLAVDFGRTHNGGFAHRALSVLRVIFHIGAYGALFDEADVIIARNLEMLAIAVRGRAAAKKRPKLIYECLDIHRLTLGRGIVGKLLRGLEAFLSRRASALFTSSPAFIENYFEPLSRVRLPVRLIENKLLAETPIVSAPRPESPPWTIGCFGILRCRKSLTMLADRAQRSQGTVRVIVRGRPALDQIPDFHDILERTDGMEFLGPYRNPEDLAAMYNAVHFAWAIDMYEEGANSAWLLPNRLYESGSFAAVPIAAAETETARFLAQRELGVVLPPPLPESMSSFFNDLTPEHYAKFERAMRAAPPKTWAYNAVDCAALVDYIAGLA